MTQLEALKSLLAKAEVGEANGKFGPIMGSYWDSDIQIDAMRAYNGSMDAALDFFADVLPEWTLSVGQNAHHKYWLAYVRFVDADFETTEYDHTDKDNPARAMFIATLKGKIAELGTKGDADV